MSRSPIVLIDEIENAGIDRKKALDLLVKKQKIVLVATHDPILALMADRRIVLKNGGIRKILKTTPAERENLAVLQLVDSAMLSIRNAVRNAESKETPFRELLREISDNSFRNAVYSKQPLKARIPHGMQKRRKQGA